MKRFRKAIKQFKRYHNTDKITATLVQDLTVDENGDVILYLCYRGQIAVVTFERHNRRLIMKSDITLY